MTPVEEMMNVGWGATMLDGIMARGVTGTSIGRGVAQAAVVAERGVLDVPSKTAASVAVGMGWDCDLLKCLLCLGL